MTQNHSHPPPETDQFIAMSAFERMEAIEKAFGEKAFLLTSLQKPSSVLMHMLHRLGAKVQILFVDTQFHFKETLEFRDQLAEAYQLTIHTLYPKLTPEQQRQKFGRELYEYIDGQPHCCRMRKEEPFLEYARKMRFQANISSLMRAEGGKRENTAPIGYDARLGIPIFNPIYDWTFEQIDEYHKEHSLPIHPLYERSFMSIGCEPCTTPVEPGEDRRAGRWRHLRTAEGGQPQYCNINFGDGEGI